MSNIVEFFKTSKHFTFEDNYFDYSGNNNAMKEDITDILAVIYEGSTADYGASNREDMNSMNDLSFMKDLKFINKTKDSTTEHEYDSGDNILGEDNLSCGNYKGNTQSNLKDVLSKHVMDGETFIAFLFKVKGSLKGYVILNKSSNTSGKLMVNVAMACSTSIIDRKRYSQVNEDLTKILEEGNIEDFCREKILKGKNKMAANEADNLTADKLLPCRNFNVVLRLASLVKMALEEESTPSGSKYLTFSDDIPLPQLRSMFTTSGIRASTEKIISAVGKLNKRMAGDITDSERRRARDRRSEDNEDDEDDDEYANSTRKVGRSREARMVDITDEDDTTQATQANNNSENSDSLFAVQVKNVATNVTKKHPDELFIRGKIVHSDLPEQDAEEAEVHYSLFINGKQRDEIEPKMELVKNIHSKKTRKRNFRIKVAVQKSDENCDATYELVVLVKTKDGQQLMKTDKIDISAPVINGLKCLDDSAYEEGDEESAPLSDNDTDNEEEGNAKIRSGAQRRKKRKTKKGLVNVDYDANNEGNALLDERKRAKKKKNKKNKNKKTKKSSNESPEVEVIEPNDRNIVPVEGQNQLVDENGELLKRNANGEFVDKDGNPLTLVQINQLKKEMNFKLDDIQRIGNNYYFIKKEYNFLGDDYINSQLTSLNGEERKKQPAKQTKVLLPKQSIKSLGIRDKDFKQHRDGTYRLNPENQQSKTSQKILEERIKTVIMEKVGKENIDFKRQITQAREAERKAFKQAVVKAKEAEEKPLNPREQRRQDQMKLEREKLEAKMKREEQHEKNKMAQLDRQQLDREQKREDQRENRRLAEDRKMMEMFMRQQERNAKRQGEMRPQKESGQDKALMERLMKMAFDQKKVKEAKPVVVKEKREKKEKAAEPTKVVVKTGKGPKQNDKQTIKQLKKILREIKRGKKTRKRQPTQKPQVSRRVRKQIIRRYIRQKVETKTRHKKRKHGPKSRNHGERKEKRSGSKPRHRHSGPKQKRSESKPKPKHKHKSAEAPKKSNHRRHKHNPASKKKRSKGAK